MSSSVLPHKSPGTPRTSVWHVFLFHLLAKSSDSLRSDDTNHLVHVPCVVFVEPPDDGGCEVCHTSCESCSGEEKNQCTQCAKGLSLASFAFRPAFIFSRLHIQLFCGDDVYSLSLSQGGFWPHREHVCQSVRGVSLPVGWALCASPALQAVYSVWTLSAAPDARALGKLSFSCRTDSVYTNVSGEGLIVVVFFI